jgi:hypothetical protein
MGTLSHVIVSYGKFGYVVMFVLVYSSCVGF